MTTHLTSAHLSGRSFSMARDYASMPDWEIDQLRQGWTLFGGKPSAELRSEIERRDRAKTIKHHWSQLERHGFGM